MLPSDERVVETAEKAEDYKAELDSIISRPLTPEIIDTYADQALQDLIGLVQKTIASYVQRHEASDFETQRDMETAAFNYYELGNIEPVLDHIADKAGELSTIDQIIDRVTITDKTIVPTDMPIRPIVQGEGSEFEHDRIPRLKTLLFIIANEFDVDIHDEEQIWIIRGQNHDRMIRQESYYSVDIPKLERTVLICDEESNATFVFNSSVVKEFGISSNDLLDLTKTDLGDLLIDNPELGVKLKYTNNFVPRLVEAIENPIQTPSHHRTAESTSYLHPKVPEGVMSMSALAEKMGIYPPAVAAVISELEEALGKRPLYRFGTNAVAPGYTPEQQDIIEKRLEEKGMLVDKAPQGILSMRGIALELSIDRHTVMRAVKALGNELGKIQRYKFGSHRTVGFNQEQQQLIFDHLENRGVFQTQASEDYRSASGIARDLSTTHSSVNKAIESLGDELGETVFQKFGAFTAISYTPEQQNQIRERLVEMGIMSEQAPDEIASVNGLGKHLGVSQGVVERAIGTLGEKLGKINKYKFNMVISSGLNAEQQRIISEYLVDRGVLSEDAPEGYRSIKGIAKTLGVADKIVRRAVHELEETLGDTTTYHFGTVCATGYSPEQQEQIVEYLRSNGSLEELASKDIASTNRLMRELHVGNMAIRRAISLINSELGEIKRYRFGGAVATGYTPAQQEMIRQAIAKNPQPR